MARWKPLDQMAVVSQYEPRVDGPAKVTGRARYTSDQQPKGLLYGALLGSPHAAARVVSVDASRAERLDGVRAVLTDVHPTGNVRYAGDYVAAVAAVTPEIARDALALIAVEYEPRAFVVDLDQALRPGAPRVFEDHENEVAADPASEGDVEAGFAAAEAVVEAEYRTQVQVHTPLEAHGSVALWEGDELTIWDSTQAVHGVREGVAKALEIPLAKVRVICEHMGGAFGSKLWAGRYTAIAARLARKAGAPVKLMLTRQQEHESAGNRPDSLQRLRLGARRDGAITAFSALTWGSGGVGGGGGLAHPWVYRYPAWSRQHHDVYTHTGEARPFRAPGCPQTSFAVEQLLDEMAEKLGLDPLEMRLRNDPNATRQQEWRLGAERIGWDRRGRPGADPGPRKRGLGLGASSWWGAGRGTKAAIDVLPDGTVEARCGTQDLGTGTRTIVAAVAAEELGLPIGAVDVRIGDSRYPFSGASGGSTTAPSVAPAVKSTAEKARAELAAIVAPHLQARPEDLIFAGGRVVAARPGGPGLSWAEACGLLGGNPLSVQGEWVEGLSSGGVAGCQFAEVEVDVETGRIAVVRVVAVADCGLVLDRLTAGSQINGGVLQGISYALYEERLMDGRTGTVVNADLEGYKILGALETPQIEVLLFDEAERGVIGLGEPPTIPTAAAVANAVYHATGVRLRQLPMTPDRVLRALRA